MALLLVLLFGKVVLLILHLSSVSPLTLGAALIRCGVIEGPSQSDCCRYGNGHTLPLAEETGSRETRQFAELSIEIAAKVCRSRRMMTLLWVFTL